MDSRYSLDINAASIRRLRPAANKFTALSAQIAIIVGGNRVDRLVDGAVSATLIRSFARPPARDSPFYVFGTVTGR